MPPQAIISHLQNEPLIFDLLTPVQKAMIGTDQMTDSSYQYSDK